MKPPPEMCLSGIQPESMETGTDLSGVVGERLEEVVERVLDKLKEWGAEAAKK
ncbi:MAG: hypothetical protein HZA16_11145 [Nitrospirae bacterium]|nr:hypothetical protein [Nitrospirota bacterium]